MRIGLMLSIYLRSRSCRVDWLWVIDSHHLMLYIFYNLKCTYQAPFGVTTLQGLGLFRGTKGLPLALGF